MSEQSAPVSTDSSPVTSTNTSASRRDASDAIVGSIRVGLPLLLWSSLLLWIVWRVPVVMRAFEDFGVAPTAINQLLFGLSRLATRFWPLMLPAIGLLGYSTWSLEQKAIRQQAETAAWRWFLLMALLPLVIWTLAEFSLIGQLHQLLNELTPR
ncbi:MAG: hypothetical protein KDA90_16125 [Planctomycetaceae bacterium]|nr:hypothetical protein [Planctomycetaceae bacterium]